MAWLKIRHMDVCVCILFFPTPMPSRLVSSHLLPGHGLLFIQAVIVRRAASLPGHSQRCYSWTTEWEAAAHLLGAAWWLVVGSVVVVVGPAGSGSYLGAQRRPPAGCGAGCPFGVEESCSWLG